jgi:hypothetical protein
MVVLIRYERGQKLLPKQHSRSGLNTFELWKASNDADKLR